MSGKSKLQPVLLGAAIFALFVSAVMAQTDTGAISGVVTDASGAVIPGAQVTITQTETNIHYSLTTNETGFYSQPALHPGPYQVEVSKPGFQPQKQTNIVLRVQDRLELNFKLGVGVANTEVTVSTQAPSLETETSSLGHVVEAQTIDDLPLNGRSFMGLSTLGAGTLPSSRSADKDSFISNGARSVQNSYLLDGIDNKNKIPGFDGTNAQIVEPVLDAIQEFKVQTSAFSAEFGQAAGGVVNVTMKSGTNSVHGNLFEFLRNSATDAAPFFQPAGDGKPVYQQNQFGATLGLPIIKNKTFFFGSWQSTREQSQAPQIASVPTANEQKGIFPSKITDPATGAPFPNNTIPVSRFDTVAAGLAPLYPLPNLPGAANNYFSNPTEKVPSDQYNLKVDHHFNENDYLFVRWSQGWQQVEEPPLMPPPANSQGFDNLNNRELVASETHIFSANKVNEFRLGFIYTHEDQQITGPRLFEQYGIKGALDSPTILGLPDFAITGLSALGTVAPGTLSIAAPGGGNYPAEKSGKVWEILDNFTWIHNRHSIKFGLDLSRITLFVYATNSARPTITMNGTYSGNGFADFLLGDVYSATTSQQQLDTFIQHVIQGYVQDDWKVSKKLTLNIGLRYELPTPFTEEHNRQANFVLDSGPCYLQLITVSQDSMCNAGIGPSQIRTDYHNFAPRIGLAYQPADKWVVRIGSGIFYGRDENLGVARRLEDNPPYVSAATFTGTTTTPVFPLAVGFPSNALSLAASGFNANTTVNSFPFDFPAPYVEQWNINVERQFAGNFVAQLGYTGSEAHKLAEVVDVNQAYPGTGTVNSRRPYQGVGDIDFYGPLVNSNYNALIAKLEHRFSNGLSLLSSYTYGHSIDDGRNNNDSSDNAPQNAHDLAADRGSSNFDVRHRFVISGFYVLPFGKSGGFVNRLIRDWQLTSIYSAQTGQPLTVTLSTDPSNTGATAHPNRIGDGNLPADERSVQHWFDTTAFAVPNCICYGNSGRMIIAAPGFQDLDLGLIRDFHFRERFRLQFRAESFNLMNHPNLGVPNTALGNAKVGTITTTINPERQNQFALKLYF